MSEELRVQDLGEQALLQRLYRFCDRTQVGDDAALVSLAKAHSLVVTTDLLVDQVHFSKQTTTAEDVGWRAAAANLSDLAAMGAEPLGITVGLGLPGHRTVHWVEALYQGLWNCLQQYQTPIVGGDVCRSSTTTVAITAFGQVLPQQAIQRNNARPGDAIVVTGVHGASRAGLELLLHPEQGKELTEITRNALIQAHQRPQPRLDVLPILRSILPSPASGVAGMDSSDGLADAVLQLCRASQVGAVLDRNQIPLPEGLTSWLSPTQAMSWALYGGEDFELVLCLPIAQAEKLVEQLEQAAIVGRIVTGSEVILHDPTSCDADEILSLTQGFQHF